MVRQGRPILGELDLGGWEVTEEYLRDYVAAVGDATPGYFQHGLVPPVALAARALGTLLEYLDLPPGAVHSLQEIAMLEPVSFDQKITGTASISPARHRGGLEFITAGFTLRDSQAREVLAGKSTVLVIQPSSPSGLGVEAVADLARPDTATTQLKTDNEAEIEPGVVKTITQDQLHAYARVSGDRNSLHLDAGFAASTRFGGIIAHGMLTLAFISEMMAAVFDRAWLETGALRVRFKGPAYLGDGVQARGRVTKQEPHFRGNKVECAVAVSNQESGQELISGTANVILSRS
jgi:3-hydroxybutyryl-CoA dehydratase